MVVIRQVTVFDELMDPLFCLKLSWGYLREAERAKERQEMKEWLETSVDFLLMAQESPPERWLLLQDGFALWLAQIDAHYGHPSSQCREPIREALIRLRYASRAVAEGKVTLACEDVAVAIKKISCDAVWRTNE